MKSLRPRIADFACLVSLSVVTSAITAFGSEDHAKDKAAIRAAIAKTDKGTKDKDIEAWMSITHPDFVAISSDGKEIIHGKEERRKNMAKVLAHLTKASQHTSITNIIFDKNGAVIEKVSNITLSTVKASQTREMNIAGTYRDLWVQKSGVWLEKRSRAIEETIKVNGESVP